MKINAFGKVLIVVVAFFFLLTVLALLGSLSDEDRPPPVVSSEAPEEKEKPKNKSLSPDDDFKKLSDFEGEWALSVPIEKIEGIACVYDGGDDKISAQGLLKIPVEINGVFDHMGHYAVTGFGYTLGKKKYNTELNKTYRIDKYHKVGHSLNDIQNYISSYCSK